MMTLYTMTSQSVAGGCSWQLQRLSSTDSANGGADSGHVQAVFVKNNRVKFHLGSHDDDLLHDDDVITSDVTASV